MTLENQIYLGDKDITGITNDFKVPYRRPDFILTLTDTNSITLYYYNKQGVKKSLIVTPNSDKRIAVYLPDDCYSIKYMFHNSYNTLVNRIVKIEGVSNVFKKYHHNSEFRGTALTYVGNPEKWDMSLADYQDILYFYDGDYSTNLNLPKCLDLSNWDLSNNPSQIRIRTSDAPTEKLILNFKGYNENLIGSAYVLYACNNLKYVDMSEIDFTKLTNITYFGIYDCPELETIKFKDGILDVRNGWNLNNTTNFGNTINILWNNKLCIPYILLPLDATRTAINYENYVVKEVKLLPDEQLTKEPEPFTTYILSEKIAIHWGTIYAMRALLKAELDLRSAKILFPVYGNCPELTHFTCYNLGARELFTDEDAPAWGSDRSFILANKCRLSGCPNWGSGSEEARQTIVDTLLTYSHDRIAEGKTAWNLGIDTAVANRLTDEEKAKIVAKGYNLILL